MPFNGPNNFGINPNLTDSCEAHCLFGSCSVDCPDQATANARGQGGGAICTCVGYLFANCACGGGGTNTDNSDNRSSVSLNIPPDKAREVLELYLNEINNKLEDSNIEANIKELSTKALNALINDNQNEYFDNVGKLEDLPIRRIDDSRCRQAAIKARRTFQNLFQG